MTETHHTKEWFEAGMLAFAGSDYEKSIDLFTRTIDADSSHTLAVISRGAAYLKQGMLDQALGDFDRAIALDPGYARAYHMRGLTNEKRGDHSAALADFNRAIELDAEYGAAYYSRAALHTTLAEADKAQEDIEMATHLGNRNLASFMNENNIWQTEHMRVEDALETELER